MATILSNLLQDMDNNSSIMNIDVDLKLSLDDWKTPNICLIL